MSFILDNFGRTLQKRKESATMILISENYKTGGSKMSGQRYTVNAMGEQCPIPVVKTKKVLDSIQGDAEIEVLVDNETAVQNLTRMGKNTGAEVFSEKKSDKEFHVFIRVKDRQPVTDTKAEEVSCIPDELGKDLMKGFLIEETQLDELPKTMLFYNGGATLTTEGSDSLEDLKSLEAQGVTIKTCGTCLNYYGLTEKLCVGEVTNMYDIVETMAKASKVIKP